MSQVTQLGPSYQSSSDTNCHCSPRPGVAAFCLCSFWVPVAALIVSFCPPLNLDSRDPVVLGIQGALLIVLLLLLPLYHRSCWVLLRWPPW